MIIVILDHVNDLLSELISISKLPHFITREDEVLKVLVLVLLFL